MQVRWLLPLGGGALALAAPHAFATQYLSVEQAQRAAFTDATFRALPAPAPAALATVTAPPGWAPQGWAVEKDGQRIGTFFVDQVIGKSEFITYALALDANGAVASIEILDYRESHGGEVRMPAWRKQFVGKTAADAAHLGGDIKIISGATLSCRHLTEGVQRLLRLQAASASTPSGAGA